MRQLRRPNARRTNIVFDSKLVERVKRLAKVKTTRDAVHVALEHYVRSRDYSGVLALRGTGGVSEVRLACAAGSAGSPAGSG
jgi:Arc/MetJ family transcription regulator